MHLLNASACPEYGLYVVFQVEYVVMKLKGKVMHSPVSHLLVLSVTLETK